jgi:hypothetical protein
MLSTSVLAAMFVHAMPAIAQLEDTGGETSSSGGGGGSRFGVGMETVLTAPFNADDVRFIFPTGAAAVSFDTGDFRIDGLLYLLFVEDDATTFALGGRFFYKLHSTTKSDFSAGAGLALGFIDGDRSDADIRVAMEGAFQIRIFLASNVALSGSAGLGFSFGDNPFIFGITGQLTGNLGLIYYFD